MVPYSEHGCNSAYLEDTSFRLIQQIHMCVYIYIHTCICMYRCVHIHIQPFLGAKNHPLPTLPTPIPSNKSPTTWSLFQGPSFFGTLPFSVPHQGEGMGGELSEPFLKEFEAGEGLDLHE